MLGLKIAAHAYIAASTNVCGAVEPCDNLAQAWEAMSSSRLAPECVGEIREDLLWSIMA